MADKALTLTSAMGIYYAEKLPILRSFIAVFFPNILTTTQHQVQVDRYTRGRNRAFYRPLGGSANLLAFDNGQSIYYAPPAIALKTPISEELAQAITVGINANNSQNEHTLAKVAMIQEQQSTDIWSEIALQATEVLRTGSFDAKTAQNQLVGEFDFDRDSSLSFGYDVGAKGGLAWLTEMYEALKLTRTPMMNLVVLAGDSFISAMEADADFQKYVSLDNYVITNGAVGEDGFMGSEVLSRLVKIKIPGTAKYCTIIQMNQTYISGGVETPYIPDNEAVMTSMNSPRYALFAGVTIADVKSGTMQTYEGEIVTDQFAQNDPDGIYIRTQSRPLMVPGNVDHICRITGSNFS